jgi:hypothetical protein
MIGSRVDPDDHLLTRSLFGTDDAEPTQEMILAWVAEQGFGRACVSTIELSVGAAVTVILTDGDERIFARRPL